MRATTVALVVSVVVSVVVALVAVAAEPVHELTRAGERAGVPWWAQTIALLLVALGGEALRRVKRQVEGEPHLSEPDGKTLRDEVRMTRQEIAAMRSHLAATHADQSADRDEMRSLRDEVRDSVAAIRKTVDAYTPGLGPIVAVHSRRIGDLERWASKPQGERGEFTPRFGDQP